MKQHTVLFITIPIVAVLLVVSTAFAVRLYTKTRPSTVIEQSAGNENSKTRGSFSDVGSSASPSPETEFSVELDAISDDGGESEVKDLKAQVNQL